MTSTEAILALRAELERLRDIVGEADVEAIDRVLEETEIIRDP